MTESKKEDLEKDPTVKNLFGFVAQPIGPTAIRSEHICLGKAISEMKQEIEKMKENAKDKVFDLFTFKVLVGLKKFKATKHRLKIHVDAAVDAFSIYTGALKSLNNFVDNRGSKNGLE